MATKRGKRAPSPKTAEIVRLVFEVSKRGEEVDDEPRAVDRGHGKTALRERHRMPPRTTTEIEHLAPTDAGEPEDLLHLFIADGKGGFRA